MNLILGMTAHSCPTSASNVINSFQRERSLTTHNLATIRGHPKERHPVFCKELNYLLLIKQIHLQNPNSPAKVEIFWRSRRKILLRSVKYAKKRVFTTLKTRAIFVPIAPLKVSKLSWSTRFKNWRLNSSRVKFAWFVNRRSIHRQVTASANLSRKSGLWARLNFWIQTKSMLVFLKLARGRSPVKSAPKIFTRSLHLKWFRKTHKIRVQKWVSQCKMLLNQRHASWTKS